jgi:hypothetical protein
MLSLSKAWPLLQPWHFDIRSALIGAGMMLLLLGLAYRFRASLRQAWTGATAPIGQLRDYLRSSAVDKYRQRVLQVTRQHTVAPQLVSLDALFVEPWLRIPASYRAAHRSEGAEEAEPDALPLHRLFGQHTRLVILGPVGAGKTALLSSLALQCAQAPEGAVEIPTLEGRLPLYVPLPTWSSSLPPTEDPFEALIDGALQAVRGPRSARRALRQALAEGRALILLDGWSALPPEDQAGVVDLLRRVITEVPDNIWVVAARDRGYAPWVEQGFAPLFLSPWQIEQVEALAQRWVEGGVGEGGPREGALADSLARGFQRGLGPLELNLQAFVALSTEEAAPLRRGALFERALDRLLPQEGEAWLLEAWHATLEEIAWQLQREGRATVRYEELIAIVDGALPAPEERPPRADRQVLRVLTTLPAILRAISPTQYGFSSPAWRAYLSARHLVSAPEDIQTLTEHLADDRWRPVFRFYAELGDVGPLIPALLKDPDDLFGARLRALGSWVVAAPPDAPWRKQAMKVLARGVLLPHLPLPSRIELMEHLAATGMSGITYFFKQMMQHQNPEVRIAATYGVAQIGGEQELPLLTQALEDPVPTVREAAVRALAWLRIDAATLLLERLFVEVDDALRPVVAEALASCGAEGDAFLREASEVDDVTLRRAAVLGLAQLEARDALERMAREDDQWIVRSAASAALAALEEREQKRGVPPPPAIDQLPWLISWAAERGEGVGTGDAARQMLRRALREGEPDVQWLAAQALTQVGQPEDVEFLRRMLNHPDPRVSRAAHEALIAIAQRYDVRVPA